MLRGRVLVPLLVEGTNLGQWLLHTAQWPGAKWKKVRGLEMSNRSEGTNAAGNFCVRITRGKIDAEVLKSLAEMAYDLGDGAGLAASCSSMILSKAASGCAPLMKMPLIKNPGVPLTPARRPSWLSC